MQRLLFFLISIQIFNQSTAQQHGSTSQQLLSALIADHRFAARKCILELDPKIDLPNPRDPSNGNTALHLLCSVPWDSRALVKILIEKGADINALNDNKDTPLHFAVAYGKFKLVMLLLKLGAIRGCCNNQGLSALHILCGRREYMQAFNTCLHRCDEPTIDYQAIDRLTCKKGIKDCINILANPPCPTLYELCLKRVAEFPAVDLQEILDNTAQYLSQTQISQEKKDAIVDKVRFDLMLEHLRSPYTDQQFFYQLVDCLPSIIMWRLADELRDEYSLLPLPINQGDNANYTPLAFAAKSGACFEIMAQLITLGARRTIKTNPVRPKNCPEDLPEEHPKFPCDLFTKVVCNCKDTHTIQRIKTLLESPLKRAGQIRMLATRKEVDEEDNKNNRTTPRIAGSPKFVTPRAINPSTRT